MSLLRPDVAATGPAGLYPRSPTQKRCERPGTCDFFKRPSYPKDRSPRGRNSHLESQRRAKSPGLRSPGPYDPPIQIRSRRTRPDRGSPHRSRSDPEGPDQTVVSGRSSRPFGQLSTSSRLVPVHQQLLMSYGSFTFLFLYSTFLMSDFQPRGSFPW